MFDKKINEKAKRAHELRIRGNCVVGLLIDYCITSECYVDVPLYVGIATEGKLAIFAPHWHGEMLTKRRLNLGMTEFVKEYSKIAP